MAWAILDVDGVLADVRHRLTYVQSRPKDWDAFFAAAPLDGVLVEGRSRARELAEQHEVLYLTGRPERCRDDTEHWLTEHEFPDAQLVMRSDTDRRPARLFKIGQVERLSRQQEVAIVVDDDDAVVGRASCRGV